MTLPPNHPGFPHIAILHAICAVGSFYTVAVRQADPPNFAHTPAGKLTFLRLWNNDSKGCIDDLFQNAYKRRYALEDSFGEKHAKLTMVAIEDSTSLGERLFECQQGIILLTFQRRASIDPGTYSSNHSSYLVLSWSCEVSQFSFLKLYKKLTCLFTDGLMCVAVIFETFCRTNRDHRCS